MTLSNLPSSDVKNDSWVGENGFLVVAELAQVIDDSVTYVRVTLEAMDRLGDIIKGKSTSKAVGGFANNKCSYKEIYIVKLAQADLGSTHRWNLQKR